MIRLLRAESQRRVPWKNGGGETAEIMIWPEGSGFDDFDWRLSRATVATSGPFSEFPGVDRTLAVLSGAGVTLELPGMAPIRLTPESPPLPFPGDLACNATLVAGVITDFNVMTRRGRYHHEMMLGEGRGRRDWGNREGFGGIHAGFGPLSCRLGDQDYALGAGDTLIIGLPAHSSVEIDTETCWLGITLTPGRIA